MNRKEFIKKTILLTGVSIIAPSLLVKTESKQKVICSNASAMFDVHYDFTNPEYGIFDGNGNVIGWKDISGNGRDAISLPIFKSDIKVKKFAVSKNDNLVEYL